MFGKKTTTKERLPMSKMPAYEALPPGPKGSTREIGSVQDFYDELEAYISKTASEDWITPQQALKMKHRLFKLAYTECCLNNKSYPVGPIAAGAVRYLRLQEYAMEQAKLGRLSYSQAIEDMLDLFKVAFPKGI